MDPYTTSKPELADPFLSTITISILVLPLTLVQFGLVITLITYIT